MAKRRKTAKRKTSRRRRVGALNFNNPMIKYGSIAAGYLLGDKINDTISKATGDKIDGKIVAAAEAGAGLLLFTSKKVKKPMLKVIGGVLAGAGIKKALSEFGVINGFENVPVLAGYSSVPVISGYTTQQPALNGFNVPRTVSASVMGSIDGSGINSTDK